MKQNLELYEEYVEDPHDVLERTRQEILENGEELEADATLLNQNLVSMAMSRRNLTPQEKEREKERKEAQDEADASAVSAQNWGIIQVLVVVFLGLVLLFLTLSKLRKGDTEEGELLEEEEV